MAGRAQNCETDSPPDTTAAAGAKLQTCPTPGSRPEAEGTPVAPSGSNGSHETGKVPPDAAETSPAPDRAKTGVTAPAPPEDEKRPDGQDRAQPGLKTPEKALPEDEDESLPLPPAEKPQARARTPLCPDLNPAPATDREAEGSPGFHRTRFSIPERCPPESQSPLSQETFPAVPSRHTTLPASCSAEGSQAITRIPTSIDDESPPTAGRVIPAGLFTHGRPQRD